MTESKKVGIKS